MQHLALGTPGLKVYGKGEWKVEKNGTDGKCRVWRKLYLAINKSTYKLVTTELSLSNATDTETLSNFLKQLRRRVIEVYGAYDTKNCHDAMRIK